jgi:hypothetical protein
MLPTPQIGQYVRLDDYGGRLIVKAVSEDGGRVDLVSEFDPKYVRNDVRCVDLLLAEDYSAES